MDNKRIATRTLSSDMSYIVNGRFKHFLIGQVEAIKDLMLKANQILSDEISLQILHEGLVEVWKDREKFIPHVVHKAKLYTKEEINAGLDVYQLLHFLSANLKKTIQDDFISPAIKIEKFRDIEVKTLREAEAIFQDIELYFQSIVNNKPFLFLVTTPPYSIIQMQDDKEVEVGNSKTMKFKPLEVILEESSRIAHSGQSNVKDLYKKLLESIVEDAKLDHLRLEHDYKMEALRRDETFKRESAERSEKHEIRMIEATGSYQFGGIVFNITMSVLFVVVGIWGSEIWNWIKERNHKEIPTITEKQSEAVLQSPSIPSPEPAPATHL